MPASAHTLASGGSACVRALACMCKEGVGGGLIFIELSLCRCCVGIIVGEGAMEMARVGARRRQGEGEGEGEDASPSSPSSSCR